MPAGTALDRFRRVSLLEGASYIALMAVAMPLKYLAGVPMAVTVVGAVHGGLFLLFGLALFVVTLDQRWSLRAAGVALLAAMIPLGAFWLERQLRRGRFPAPRDATTAPG